MQRSTRTAFTVIELLIVIVILGILATIIWPRVRHRGGDGAPARLVQVAASDSMLAPGAMREVIIRAENPRGRPVSGAEVRFAVATGGGRVDPATVRTDRDGLAIVQWTLGGVPGPNTLTATADGVPALTISRVADASVRPATPGAAPAPSPASPAPATTTPAPATP